MRHRIATGVVALVVIAGLVTACGGDQAGDDDLRPHLVSLLTENALLSNDEADCYAEIMIEEMDDGALRQAIEIGDEPSLPDHVAELAFNDCLDLEELLDQLDLDLELDFEPDDLQLDQ